MTGGDEVVPGAVSVSPEVVEYMTGYFTGGVGRFVTDTFGIILKPFDPDRELTINDVPILNRLTGQKSPWVDRSLFYERRGQVDQAVERATTYIERGMSDQLQGYVEANRPLLTLEPAMKAVDRQLRNTRKARRELERARELEQISDEQYRATRDTINEAERVVMVQFNTLWNQTMRPPEPAPVE